LAAQTSNLTNFNTLARAGEYTSGGNAYRWINRTNAQTSNNSYAVLSYSDASFIPGAAAISLSSQTTNYLVCTGLSSTIPAGSTINGITVKIERYNSNTSEEAPLTVVDSAIYLTKDGTTTVGSNKSAAATWQTTDNNTTVDFGGAADLWGTTLTAAEVNASTFGVMISPSISYNNYNEIGGSILIDYVTITIEYTGGAVRRRAVFSSECNFD
jgi:hypothetical protein